MKAPILQGFGFGGMTGLLSQIPLLLIELRKGNQLSSFGSEGQVRLPEVEKNPGSGLWVRISDFGFQVRLPEVEKDSDLPNVP